MTFQVLFDAQNQFTRGQMYNSIKSKVENYNLKPFYMEYEYLDNHLREIYNSTQGITQKIWRLLFPYDVIKSYTTSVIERFKLTNITGEKDCLPQKTSDFYATSDF